MSTDCTWRLLNSRKLEDFHHERIAGLVIELCINFKISARYKYPIMKMPATVAATICIFLDELLTVHARG